MFYEFIFNNVNSWDRKFEKVRNNVLYFFIIFYNEVKIKVDKYKIENFFN